MSDHSYHRIGSRVEAPRRGLMVRSAESSRLLGLRRLPASMRDEIIRRFLGKMQGSARPTIIGRSDDIALLADIIRELDYLPGDGNEDLAAVLAEFNKRKWARL